MEKLANKFRVLLVLMFIQSFHPGFTGSDQTQNNPYKSPAQITRLHDFLKNRMAPIASCMQQHLLNPCSGGLYGIPANIIYPGDSIISVITWQSIITVTFSNDQNPVLLLLLTAIIAADGTVTFTASPGDINSQILFENPSTIAALKLTWSFPKH